MRVTCTILEREPPPHISTEDPSGPCSPEDAIPATPKRLNEGFYKDSCKGISETPKPP